jgi:hypothetical protein
MIPGLDNAETMASWPADEARMEAEYIMELLECEDKDYIHQRIIKIRQHWIKVFDNDSDMKLFSDTFNNICFNKIGVAI